MNQIIEAIRRCIEQNNFIEACKRADELDCQVVDDIGLVIDIISAYEEVHQKEKTERWSHRAVQLEEDEANYDRLAGIQTGLGHYTDLKKTLDYMEGEGYLTFDYYKSLYLLKLHEHADINELVQILEALIEDYYDKAYMLKLACYYVLMEQKEEAVAICQKVMRLYNHTEYSQQAKAILDQLQKGEKLASDFLQGIIDAGREEIIRKDAAPVIRIEGTAAASADLEKNMVMQVTYPEIEDEFAGLVGMKDIKQQLVQYYMKMEFEQKRQERYGYEPDLSRGYHFILTGNPGTGKTTVARIIAKILHNIGIREKNTFIQKTSGDLISGYEGGTVENVNNAIAEAEGGVLFIDEAYTLYDPDQPDKEGKKAIETLLVDMENRRNAYTVILAGYKDKMKDLMKVNPGFCSRFAKTFHIPDYSDDELIEIAEQIAGEKNYVLEEKAKQGIKKRIEREKVDDKFGNARFIRKLMEDATDHLALRVAAMKNHNATDDHLLLYEDFVDEEFDKSLEELLEELNRMVGLRIVKEQVNMLISDISYQKEALERGYKLDTTSQFMNMVFVGGAGTGKTTVAKLIGKIYYALGILKRGDVFVESSRVDFVGQYLGSTGVNTKAMVDKALGGILFIDEAYALCAYEDDKFGMEAVNALVKYIDQYKDRLMVIMAGYTQDMERFMKTNQGLTRRFPTVIEFEDYNSEELTDIFYSFLEKKGKNNEGLRIEKGLREEIKSYLEECAANHDFGNAGGVVNICNKVVQRHRSRITAMLRTNQKVSDNDFITITREDIGLEADNTDMLTAETD